MVSQIAERLGVPEEVIASDRKQITANIQKLRTLFYFPRDLSFLFILLSPKDPGQ